MREYRSFKELVDQNKSLFKRIVAQGDMDLLEACWQARDPEIRNYQKKIVFKDQKIEELQKSLEEKTTLAEDIDKELRSTREGLSSTQEALENAKKNIASLENFNKELLLSNTDLQDDIVKLEELVSAKDHEFTELSEEVDRERLENNIELKNAKEAISYADELEELQSKNVKYIQDLEKRLHQAELGAERSLKELNKMKEAQDIFEKEKVGTAQSLKIERENRKKLEHRYRFAIDQNKDLEKKLREQTERSTALIASREQKTKNMDQLQATLNMKARLLGERDEEVQNITNKISKQNEMLHAYEEEIVTLEKALEESAENQKNLEDYAEKLKVTTEREIIRRKEIETKNEGMRLKLSLIISEKENAEARLSALEETMSKIQHQLTPKKSAIRPRHQQPQLDN